jgi:hypothetical protein
MRLTSSGVGGSVVIHIAAYADPGSGSKWFRPVAMQSIEGVPSVVVPRTALKSASDT